MYFENYILILTYWLILIISCLARFLSLYFPVCRAMIIIHRIPINPARGAGDFVVAGLVGGINDGSVEAGT